MAERHIFCGFSTSSTSNLLPSPVSYKDVPVFVLSAENLASRFRFLFAKLPKSRSENDCHCDKHVNMKCVRVRRLFLLQNKHIYSILRLIHSLYLFIYLPSTLHVLEPSKWSMLTKVLHVRINNYWLLLFPNHLYLTKTYLQYPNWLTNWSQNMYVLGQFIWYKIFAPQEQIRDLIPVSLILGVFT